METGIDFLTKHLTRPLISGIKDDILSFDNANGLLVCDCCNRESSQWLYPAQYIACEPYPKSKEIHCLACHTLFIGSGDHFGPGARNNKLGMMRGLGALVTPSCNTVYATGKHYERFTNLKSSLFDDVVELAGLACINDAWIRAPKNEPFLLITDFGVKKSSLISNLHVSQGGYVAVCSEKDHYLVEREAMPAIETFTGLAKKQATEFLDVLLKKTRQHIKVSELSFITETCKEHPNLLNIIKKLPSDPHTREFILRVVRRNLESLK